MSETQTTKLPPQTVTGQNSAILFGALDRAVNNAFDSFRDNLQVSELLNAQLIKEDLAKRIEREINLIEIQMPALVEITVAPSKDKFERFFFLKAWIESTDFEGDDICITRVIGFHAQSPKREMN